MLQVHNLCYIPCLINILVCKCYLCCYITCYYIVVYNIILYHCHMAKNKCYISRKDVKNCVLYLKKNRMLVHMLNMIIYLHIFNQIYSAIYIPC